jgi:hypothetical protein
LLNPDFTSGDAWTASGGATLTCGAAQLSADAICNFGGIRQTFTSPGVSCARPLVLTLVDEDLIMSVTGFNFALPPLAISLNGGWNVITSFPPTSLCLGARVLDGTADLFIGAIRPLVACTGIQYGFMGITHVSVDADTTGTCPAYGTVVNGDFEAGSTGWLHPAAPNVPVVIEAGAGAGGSSAARLSCALLSGLFSIPTAAMVPNPALQIWSLGPSSDVVEVTIGSSTGTALAGTGLAVKRTLCMPRWAQGTVQPISFAVAPRDGGPCTDGDTSLLDDLAFISDPACAADANLFDPGFEQSTSATTAPQWVASGDARIVVAPAFAHSGNAAAVLSVAPTAPCPTTLLSANVTIPSPVGAAGPALKFWYQTSAETPNSDVVELANVFFDQTVRLAPASVWTQKTLCLDPHYAGRPDVLTFAANDPNHGGDCPAAATSPRTLAIDDIELTVDVSCPAK